MGRYASVSMRLKSIQPCLTVAARINAIEQGIYMQADAILKVGSSTYVAQENHADARQKCARRQLYSMHKPLF